MINFILQRDKQLHFFCSACAALITVIILNFFFDFHPVVTWVLGITVGMVPGVGKEVIDSRKGGSGWSWPDLLADLIGTALGAAIVFT